MGRLGIDLSGDSVILASVSPAVGRLQLRDFDRVDANGDPLVLVEDLRRARRQHRFPRRAEVVAWAGDPRVNAVRQAGFRIERTITPGVALERVARIHHELSGIPGVTAVLSIDESGGALAIVRDEVVLQETALTWSSRAAGDSSDSDLLRRYSFLSELTETLGAAFGSVLRSQNARVQEILTCGSLPDLRSLTMPLADEFDVEVETLDSMSAIDVRVKGRMPEEIADALPTLWTAMAASRRWHRRPAQPVKRLLKIAVPAGVAAGFAMMFLAGGRPGDSARSSAPPIQTGPRGTRLPGDGQKIPAGSRAGTAAVPRGEASKAPVVLPPAAQTLTLPAPSGEPVRTEPPRTAWSAGASQTAPPPQVMARPSESNQGAELTPAPQPVNTRPIERVAAANAALPLRPQEPLAPVRASEPPVVQRPSEPLLAPTRSATEAEQLDQSNRSRTRPNRSASADLTDLPRISLPLTSILWSPERKLVVADGRTLEVGDTILGMRIVAIEQDSVVVRDRAGRLRRAGLRRPGPETMP